MDEKEQAAFAAGIAAQSAENDKITAALQAVGAELWAYKVTALALAARAKPDARAEAIALLETMLLNLPPDVPANGVPAFRTAAMLLLQQLAAPERSPPEPQTRQ